MKIVALTALVAFLVIGTLVGVRMLLLARRTHGLPELLLGAGLTSLAFVTVPAIGISLGAGLFSKGVQTTVFAVGLLPVVGLAMCFTAFTAHVFRPGRTWAKACVWLAGAVAACGVVGTVSERLAAWEVDRVVGAGWSILLVVPFLLAMGWTGLESLTYHRRLRRRLRLGLADPVVCNRFLLWALGNLGAVTGSALIPISLALGWRLVNHPLPILGIALAGLMLSGTWYLAFLPPDGYLRRIRSRAPAQPVAG